MRPLSYSSISIYLECPLKYKLKYIDGLKEKPKSYFSFGTSLHIALEFMYSYRPPPPSLDDVLKHFDENWVLEGYSSKEEEEGYFSYGKKILTEYYEKHAKALKPPIAVEYMFNLEIEGIPVTGFIDRVDRIDGNHAEIIDYKSGRNIFTKSHVEENEQLTLYQWAVRESIGLPVKRLTLYHLPSQTPVSSKARSEDKIDELKGKILMVAHLIEKGVFPAQKGRFCPCDFPEHCPYYKYIYMKEEETENPPVKIQLTIEQYCELKEKEGEIEKKIKELAAQIHEYCQKEGLQRLFGDKHIISRITTEKKGFNDVKLKELLEPLGLWERVLSYDDSLAKKLLENGYIEEKLKDEIRRLEKVKRTSFQLRIKEIKKEEG